MPDIYPRRVVHTPSADTPSGPDPAAPLGWQRAIAQAIIDAGVESAVYVPDARLGQSLAGPDGPGDRRPAGRALRPVLSGGRRRRGGGDRCRRVAPRVRDGRACRADPGAAVGRAT